MGNLNSIINWEQQVIINNFSLNHNLEREKELSELGDKSEVGELKNRMKALMNKL